MTTLSKAAKLGLKLLFTLVLVICLYETWRVTMARKITETKFAEILTNPDLSIKQGDITDRQIKILLTVEDPNFYHHNGIDMDTPGAGLTTITQALAKRLFFKDFKKGFAKIEQSLIARYAINAKISKDKQLLTFLNIAYFGRCDGALIYGFSGAALCYYGKDFSKLSEEEYIKLVAMLIGPGRFNPDFADKGLNKRVEKITRLLSGACAPESNRDVYYQNC